MKIPGEEELFSKLPPDMRAYFHFGKIISFSMEEIFDLEECDYTYIGKLILADETYTHKIMVDMKGIYGDMHINIGAYVSGLNIINLTTRGFEKCCSYLISDFEQSADIKIYCAELNVSLLET